MYSQQQINKFIAEFNKAVIKYNKKKKSGYSYINEEPYYHGCPDDLLGCHAAKWLKFVSEEEDAQRIYVLLAIHNLDNNELPISIKNIITKYGMDYELTDYTMIIFIDVA